MRPQLLHPTIKNGPGVTDSRVTVPHHVVSVHEHRDAGDPGVKVEVVGVVGGGGVVVLVEVEQDDGRAVGQPLEVHRAALQRRRLSTTHQPITARHYVPMHDTTQFEFFNGVNC